MKEKEKGKSHPFAGHLRPTEEVLWIVSQEGSSPWVALRQSQEALMRWGVVWAFLLIMFAIFKVMNAPISQTFYFAISVSLLGTMMFLGWRTFKDQSRGRAYAITTERLLYRDPQSVSAIPLEEISILNIISEAGQEGLSFGPLFPIWFNIKEAEHVKVLIHDAREKRLKEIGR
jgi:hypothetical protein